MGAAGTPVGPRHGAPRILLVNPRYPVNTWSFSEAADITGYPVAMPNLALPTLAALTPADAGVEVSLADENVAPLDLDVDVDVVGITGYVTQHERMVELADEFRRRGRTVLIGGPFATLSPDAVRPHADVLFTGEAEQTWPAFLADLAAGAPAAEYAAEATVDLARSPAPRTDLLPAGAYGLGVVQTSRGCPYACEFCDVIVYLGRRQRHKEPAQIIAELDALYEAGQRKVFLSDDNFTANPKAAREIVAALGEWNATKPERTTFHTQLSIDVAAPRNADLLEAAAAAGLEYVFVGLETDDTDSLLEVRKKQNTHRDMVESVHRIQRHGIQVMAGLIVGFDADTTACFADRLDLAQRAGIPMVAVSLLNAPEGTPLAARAEAEGRVRGQTSNFYFSTNLEPVRMTTDQLALGAAWLMNRLYAPGPFLERMRAFASRLPDLTDADEPVDHHDGIETWTRLRRTYARLGATAGADAPPTPVGEGRTRGLDPMARLPFEAVRAFKGKDVEHAVQALIFHRHVVGVLQHWGVWDPGLGACTSYEEAVEHGPPAGALRAGAIERLTASSA